MSRTYRFNRRGPRHPYVGFLGRSLTDADLEHDWQLYLTAGFDWYWQGCPLNSKKKAFAARRAREFRDGAHRMSAPKSYRKVRNRKLRGRQKQALHNYCSDVDLLVPTFVHDAAWYYW